MCCRLARRVDFFRGLSRVFRNSIIDADTTITWHSYGIRNTWFKACAKAALPPGVQPRHDPMQPWYVDWVMIPTMAFVRSMEDVLAVASALPAASGADTVTGHDGGCGTKNNNNGSTTAGSSSKQQQQ